MSFYVVVLRIRLSFEFPSGSKVIVGVPFPNFIRELCDGDSGGCMSLCSLTLFFSSIQLLHDSLKLSLYSSIWDCGGLNRNGPRRSMCLNAWP